MHVYICICIYTNTNGICTIWYKITTGHKIEHKAMKDINFTFCPMGTDSWQWATPRQRVAPLLVFLQKKGTVAGFPGFPTSSAWLDPSLPRNDHSCIPHILRPQDCCQTYNVPLWDSSNYMVTPKKSKCPHQSPPFRQNYPHQAFRACQVICGNSPEINCVCRNNWWAARG